MQLSGADSVQQAVASDFVGKFRFTGRLFLSRFRRDKGAIVDVSSLSFYSALSVGDYYQNLVIMYGIPVRLVVVMDTVSVNQFRDKLKTFVEQVVENHTPLKVTRRAGESFVVLSADDYEREQETLHVLQNSSLMKQIAESSVTHAKGGGYCPTSEEMNEITGI